MSKRYRFYVVPGTLPPEAWLVKAQDPGAPQAEYIQGFPTQADAIQYAVQVARKLCESGELAQVHVQRPDGRFRIEWTYSDDPPEHQG